MGVVKAIKQPSAIKKSQRQTGKRKERRRRSVCTQVAGTAHGRATRHPPSILRPSDPFLPWRADLRVGRSALLSTSHVPLLQQTCTNGAFARATDPVAAPRLRPAQSPDQAARSGMGLLLGPDDLAVQWASGFWPTDSSDAITQLNAHNESRCCCSSCPGCSCSDSLHGNSWRCCSNCRREEPDTNQT